MGKRVCSYDPAKTDGSIMEKTCKDFSVDAPNPLDSFGVFLIC